MASTGVGIDAFFSLANSHLPHGARGNYNNNNDPSALQNPLGWRLISHFCSPQPDTSLAASSLAWGKRTEGTCQLLPQRTAAPDFCQITEGWLGRVDLGQLCANSLLKGITQRLESPLGDMNPGPSGYETIQIFGGFALCLAAVKFVTFVSLTCGAVGDYLLCLSICVDTQLRLPHQFKVIALNLWCFIQNLDIIGPPIL